MKSAILATLSLVSFTAASAVEVIGMYTTTYAANSEATSAAPQAAYGANYATTTTPAPAATQTYDIYSAMPYTSMTAGGYQQLQCGYGWSKDSQGRCVKDNWVSFIRTSQDIRRCCFCLGRALLRHPRDF